MSTTFTDRDGETFEAVAITTTQRELIELKSDHGQSLTFHARDAHAIIKLVQEASK